MNSKTGNAWPQPKFAFSSMTTEDHLNYIEAQIAEMQRTLARLDECVEALLSNGQRLRLLSEHRTGVRNG